VLRKRRAQVFVSNVRPTFDFANTGRLLPEKREAAAWRQLPRAEQNMRIIVIVPNPTTD